MQNIAPDTSIVDTLDRIIASVGELPASPVIVSSVMGLTSNLDARLDEVTDALASDQSLTAKVLKLSNSSFFGRPKQVTTLSEAILVLGFYNVRSLVVATSAHSMYSRGKKGGPEEKLWQHSLSSAVASRMIAEYTNYPDKEELFIAALLHDIGKLVLLQKLPDAYRRIVQMVEQTGGEFHREEVKTFGFTHSDVAAALLEKWSFPAGLIEVIHKHHRISEIEDEHMLQTVHLLDLGNCVAKKMGVGFKDRQVENLAELESAAALSIDGEALETIYEKCVEAYEAGSNVFEDA